MKNLWNSSNPGERKTFSRRRSISLLLALLLALSLVATGCQNNTEEPPVQDPVEEEPLNELPLIEDEALLAKIEETCRPYIEHKGYTGVSIGVIKDGKIAYFNYHLRDRLQHQALYGGAAGSAGQPAGGQAGSAHL